MKERTSHLAGLWIGAAISNTSHSNKASRLIEVTLVADAFCQAMVRSLVGAMTTIGRGHRDLDWLDRQWQLPGRSNDTPVMPAKGLTLEEVSYPSADQWADRNRQARQRRDKPEEEHL
ncbi:MAG: hypothetical protein LBV30_08390 [Propionibacteriaceae bacterium]|jgi:tRNA pseudouridine38-40 synthase|nr:hypothetical protein [Propionibacteriaceae bacterium]